MSDPELSNQKNERQAEEGWGETNSSLSMKSIHKGVANGFIDLEFLLPPKFGTSNYFYSP